MNAETIKEEIKKSYGGIAKNKTSAGCCSDTACCTSDDLGTYMKVEYSGVEGYHEEADLALGCGIPTEIANISLGDTVVDLGSGAGNDAFIARSIVGETGRVIGIDMTPEMVIRALQNNQKVGYKNVEFVLGEIEDMSPIKDSVADVVISNCVMNLVPDKVKAFSEVYRILKEGGHFSISDIVYAGNLPGGLLEAAEMYAGCVAGASEKNEYLGVIKTIGFKNISVKKERKINLPDSLMLQYISAEELAAYKKSGSGIYSITVYADKLEEGACCEPSNNGCCGSEIKNNADNTNCCDSESNKGSSCC